MFISTDIYDLVALHSIDVHVSQCEINKYQSHKHIVLLLLIVGNTLEIPRKYLDWLSEVTYIPKYLPRYT